MSLMQLQLIGPMDFDAHIRKELRTIFIDGGLNHLDRLKICPADFKECMSIGDNDSNTTNYKMQTLLNIEKDFSDLSFALDSIKNEDIHHLSLLGFLGKRRDHELANYFELLNFCDNKSSCFISLENKVIITNQENFTLSHQGIFSLFASNDTNLSISGSVKYSLDNKQIRKFSTHGLSNISHGEILVINPKKASLVIFLNESGCV